MSPTSWFSAFAAMALPLKLIPNDAYTKWLLVDHEDRSLSIEKLSQTEYAQLPEGIKTSLLQSAAEYSSLFDLTSGEYGSSHTECYLCGTSPTSKKSKSTARKPYESLAHFKERIEHEKELLETKTVYLLDPAGNNSSLKVEQSNEWQKDSHTWGDEVEAKKIACHEGKRLDVPDKDKKLKVEEQEKTLDDHVAKKVSVFGTRNTSSLTGSSLASLLVKTRPYACRSSKRKSPISPSPDHASVSHLVPAKSFAESQGEFTFSFEIPQKPHDAGKNVSPFIQATDQGPIGVLNGVLDAEDEHESASASLSKPSGVLESLAAAKIPYVGPAIESVTESGSFKIQQMVNASAINDAATEDIHRPTSSLDNETEHVATQDVAPTSLSITKYDEIFGGIAEENSKSEFGYTERGQFNCWMFWRDPPRPLEDLADEEDTDASIDLEDHLAFPTGTRQEILPGVPVTIYTPRSASDMEEHECFWNIWIPPIESLDTDDEEETSSHFSEILTVESGSLFGRLNNVSAPNTEEENQESTSDGEVTSKETGDGHSNQFAFVEEVHDGSPQDRKDNEEMGDREKVDEEMKDNEQVDADIGGRKVIITYIRTTKVVKTTKMVKGKKNTMAARMAKTVRTVITVMQF